MTDLRKFLPEARLEVVRAIEAGFLDDQIAIWAEDFRAGPDGEAALAVMRARLVEAFGEPIPSVAEVSWQDRKGDDGPHLGPGAWLFRAICDRDSVVQGIA